jgi:hypothetical protein
MPSFSTFPVNDIVTQANNNLLRMSVSPIDYMPVYEPTTTNIDDIRYIAASQLELSDQVRVTKTYTTTHDGVLRK